VPIVVCLLASACGDDDAATASRPDQSSDVVPESTIVETDAGDVYRDPQGTYTITIGSDWTETSGAMVQEIESWAVAPPSDGFADNVNVLTQAAQGLDLEQYMDLSSQNLGGLDLIEQSTIEGTNGNELGLLEYEGVPAGAPSDRPLHFLATVAVQDGQAVVATLSASADTFEARRSSVEPFLRTLQAT
jgi:hypothetical protein